MRAMCTLALVVIAIAKVHGEEPYQLDLNVISQQPSSVPVEEVNQWRQIKVVELFKQAGATRVVEQKVLRNGTSDIGLPVKNVIVQLDGKSDDTIVVGAHLDKHPNGLGDGAVDNWSGVVSVVHLYRELRKLPARDHTYVFIAFAYEEDLLWGSKTYVTKLKPNELARIRYMVNLECLGVAHVHIWKNGSDPALIQRAEELAAANRITVESRNLPDGVISDSIPFSDEGIPTITFDSLRQEDFALLHSKDDLLGKVDSNTLGKGIEFTRQYLLELDQPNP
ncbi:MAG: hypothetical protein AMXMBFR84_42550 [Candidatus Hydrogenedentota bacterium]